MKSDNKEEKPLKDEILIEESSSTDDYFKIKIEKCLEEIKKDLRYLPCQTAGDDCLQKENIKEVKKDLQKTQKNYEERVQPLAQSYKLLDQKTDSQQKILENIVTIQRDMNNKLDEAKLEVQETRLEHTKEISDLKLNLITQMQAVITIRDTKQETQDRIMDIIKFLFGLAVSILAIYGAISAVGAGF